MGKYRKKPVVIEASRWFKHGDHPAVEMGPPEEYLGVCPTCGQTMTRHGRLQNVTVAEEWSVVCPSDWIITGVKGEVYPCSDEIFTETYEPVGP